MTRPAFEHSGVHEGETIAAALRRHAAWIALATRQLNDEGKEAIVRVLDELNEQATGILALSIEVDHLEAVANHFLKPKADEAA